MNHDPTNRLLEVCVLHPRSGFVNLLRNLCLLLVILRPMAYSSLFHFRAGDPGNRLWICSGFRHGSMLS